METENTKLFLGLITVTHVSNDWPKDVFPDQSLELNTSNIKIVHYSDCQQLVIWLPSNGYLYEDITMFSLDKSLNIWKYRVRDVLNGNIQLIIDTVEIPDGRYLCTIKKADGLAHKIYFTKSEEKAIDPSKIFENIQNEEEELKRTNNFKMDIINKIFRSVKYQNDGRGGYVHYKEGLKKISFYMEYGGGDCVVILDIPSDEKWESDKNFPLSRKAEIVEHVAKMTNRDQCPSCYYVIDEKSILFMKK